MCEESFMPHPDEFRVTELELRVSQLEEQHDVLTSLVRGLAESRVTLLERNVPELARELREVRAALEALIADPGQPHASANAAADVLDGE